MTYIANTWDDATQRYAKSEHELPYHITRWFDEINRCGSGGRGEFFLTPGQTGTAIKLIVRVKGLSMAQMAWNLDTGKLLSAHKFNDYYWEWREVTPGTARRYIHKLSGIKN